MSKRNFTTSDSWGASSTKKNRLYDNYDACLTYKDYTVGWLCAINIEFAAACAFLDEKHRRPEFGLGDDDTAYAFGRMGYHNVVIAVLSEGDYGIVSAAVVARDMHRSFPNIRVSLMVGIGGGAPLRHDIRLGDVVVSVPKNGSSGVFQYDFGKTIQNQTFQQTGALNQPPELLRGAVARLEAEYKTNGHTLDETVSCVLQKHPTLQAQCKRPPLDSDVLYRADVVHPPGPEIHCDEVCGRDLSQIETRRVRNEGGEHGTKIHFGTIASANRVMKDASIRDKLSSQRDVLCFEMEAAGLMSSNKPYLIVRGICDYSDSHKNKIWQGYASMIAAAYARDLLCHIPKQVVADGDKTELSRRIEKKNASSQSHRGRTESLNDNQICALLDSLKFDQIDARRLTIRKAHTKTCQWFLKQSEYLDWLRHSNLTKTDGILWIRGKPGAGKSTLMKFALDSSKTTMKDALIISFFFNARGNDLEKSTIGMYRSLVLQLLRKVPNLRGVLSSVDLPENALYQWNIELLEDIFQQAVLSLHDLPLVCFIDALDEAEEDQIRNMISFFEQTGELARSSNIPFRSCFASRHYPHISLKKGVEMTLELQEGHSQDIIKYLDSELRIGDGETAEPLRNQIQNKSSGVFLWVVLVVNILNKEHDGGCIPGQLEKKIENIPGDLHTLFRNIIMRDDVRKEEMLLCIQWVLFARRPLTPAELYFAILSGIGPKAPNDTDPNQVTISIAEKRIINFSKGLAEITKSRSPTVQFIHESVRDFLLKENVFGDLWSELEDKPVGKGHDKLKECCIQYMNSFDVANTLGISESIFEDEFRSLSPDQRTAYCQFADQAFPFMQYATQNILYHSDIAQGEGIDQISFLNHFQLSSWIRLDNLFEKHRIRRHTKNASLLYILAEHNLANLIRRHPHKLHGFKREEERYGIPILAASATGSREAGQALLQAHAETHPASVIYSLHEQYYNRSYKLNPTRKFHLTRERTIMSIFAEYGDDISALFYLLSETDGLSFGEEDLQHVLLIYACQGNRESMIDLLLHLGVCHGSRAEVTKAVMFYASERFNGIDYEPLYYIFRSMLDLTPHTCQRLFSWASRRHHIDMLEMLLAHGKIDFNLRDEFGQTPLSSAARNGHDGIVKLLLETEKVDINSRDNVGYTPLILAATNGHYGISKLLLETGKVDINSRDEFDQTPLSLAAGNGHDGMVKLLLETEKVNINSRDEFDRTPLSLAAERGYDKVVKLLLETGKVDETL